MPRQVVNRGKKPRKNRNLVNLQRKIIDLCVCVCSDVKPKINPPLTCKIEGKPSNQQKQTTKPTKKLGTIERNAK